MDWSATMCTTPTAKPIDLVAIQPSPGKVLTVDHGRAGSSLGIFPPGWSLQGEIHRLGAGAGQDSTSQRSAMPEPSAPPRSFHNDDNEHLGTSRPGDSIRGVLQLEPSQCSPTSGLDTCVARLDGREVRLRTPTANLGIPATLGKFTTPHLEGDLAADAFGQGTDLVDPLSQASVAAAIEGARGAPPVLVFGPRSGRFFRRARWPRHGFGTCGP